MNRKKNKHYLETEQKIQTTLLDLAKEKKTPTVAEICRRCQINRTTFYLHYVDILDLMAKIQENIFQQFTSSVINSHQEITLMSHISYLLFAEHVKENKDFYRFYFSINTTFPLKDGFENMWDSIIVPYFKKHSIHNEEIMRLRFVCFQAAFTITLRNWVNDDCRISCEEVAQILTECITL